MPRTVICHRFARGARVHWGYDRTTVYVVDWWRYEAHLLSSFVRYALVQEGTTGGPVVMADEADLWPAEAPVVSPSEDTGRRKGTTWCDACARWVPWCPHVKKECYS